MAPHHPEARFQRPQDLIDHYKRVNARLNTAGYRFERKRREEERQAREAERLVVAARIAAQEETKRVFVRTLAPLHLREPVPAVITRIANVHGFSAEDLRGPGRTHSLVRARWAAIAELRDVYPEMSVHRLGQHIGRDHATVRHALLQMGLPL